MAHIRQSRPDLDLGSQTNVFKSRQIRTACRDFGHAVRICHLWSEKKPGFRRLTIPDQTATVLGGGRHQRAVACVRRSCTIQGYLALTKQCPPTTQQKDYAWGRTVVLRGSGVSYGVGWHQRAVACVRARLYLGGGASG